MAPTCEPTRPSPSRPDVAARVRTTSSPDTSGSAPRRCPTPSWVLAQAEGAAGEGLSCFLLPRILPDGTRNVFRIQRLKNKLGNKSNASSEIELDGTVGTMIGEPGRGVRTIIEMVSQTRLDCILGSTAGMRQSVAEAVWHARHRSRFRCRPWQISRR